MTGKAGNTQSVSFQFKDTIGNFNNIINIPIKATTTFTNKGVIAYTLQYSYSSSLLSAQSPVTTGTISNAFGTPTVNTNVPGIITIAGVGTSPLTSTGNFIILRFKVIGAGYATISSTGAANNYFNQGTPIINYLNSCTVNCLPTPTISVNPTGGVILKGQTLQFGASGGTVPYTWNSSSTTTATISSTGLMTAVKEGFTNIKATDNKGYFGVVNNIEVRAYQLTIPDTNGTYNGFVSIPVRTTNLNGLSILSGNVNISFDPGLLTNIQIETTNSLLQSFTPPLVNSSTAGLIKLSFANTTSLSGVGVLFWIKAKLSNAAGGYSPLTINSALLNEDLIPLLQNGSIQYAPAPTISIAPASGQLVFGDSLQFSINEPHATTPFTWSVSDNALATINANGILKVKKSGKVSVSVIDGQSLTATSGIFQLYDTYLKIGDTSAIAGSQIDVPISIKSLPSGQGILSFEGKIFTSNPTLFTLTDIITTGTSSANFSVSRVVKPGYIQFAVAGISPIPGNSILFKVRGTLSSTAPFGYASTLSFQDLLINEGTPLPFIQTGSINTTSVYTFIGTGNWSDPNNWVNGLVPPSDLQGNDRIIINPAGTGECILDVAQHISAGAKLTVNPGKKFRVLGDFNIVQ